MLFGTAGIPPSTLQSSSSNGIARIRALGLDCMELAFVRSVRMGPESAAFVNQTALQQRVALSVHAPYYINLNAADSDKLSASRERILKAARVGWLCGAPHVVFHAGYYHQDPADTVFDRIKNHLLELSQQLRSEGVSVWLRPETTGRTAQFGTLDEILELSAQVEGVAPCVDIAHIHARSGCNNSYAEFVTLLGSIESRLGRTGLDDMHIHVSGIDFGSRGEKRHLLLDESDLDYAGLLRALVAVDARGRLICESPNTERDALMLQETYARLLECRPSA